MIELKGVSKRFDSFTALDNVDLTIETGTAFGLLGSNGAGKSTILRLLSGIYRQEGGEVLNSTHFPCYIRSFFFLY